MKLSVIIPVYNEKNTINEVIDKVCSVDIGNVDKEVVVVDDGSTDGTAEILCNKKKANESINLCICEQNAGKGCAVRKGLEYATGDIVIIQDADLELNPDEYRQLIAPIIEGKAEVVYGTRFWHKVEGMSFFAIFANKCIIFVTNLLYGSHLTDVETAYKLFKLDMIKTLNLKSEAFEIEVETTAKVLKKGCKIYEIPISYNPRPVQGGKKVNWLDGVKAIYYLIKYRFFD